MRRVQQPVDLLLIGVVALVLQECVDLFNAGRQARQIQAQAPQYRDTVGFRRWRQFFSFEAGKDEIVDGIFGPASVYDLRQRRSLRWNVRPMFLNRDNLPSGAVRPLGALIDPCANQLNLGRVQRFSA